MPINALTMLISTIATLCSWMFVSSRLRMNSSSNTHQAHLLVNSFLFSGFYGLMMFLPQLLVITSPDIYPTVMVYAFVIGHAVLYISFLQIFRLTFSMIPRLKNKEFIAIAIGVIAILIMIWFGITTMINGIHPSYNAVDRITSLNVSPQINIIDTVVGILFVVPAAILMIYNGITNRSSRVRSLLLGFGMAIPMFTGPLVESATSLDLHFVIANTFSVIGLLVLTLGVAYRMDQNISLAKAATARR